MAAEDDEEYTYASIATRRKRERGSVSLVRLPDDFYERVDAYLRTLREEYQREHASNPATPKVLILQDELVKLQEAREDIYDMRERKLVSAAIVAARGGNPDRGHMTKEEAILFDEVLRTLRESRRNLLRRGAAPPREGPKPVGGPPTAPEPAPMPAFAAQPAAVLAERAPPEEVPPEAPLPGKPPAPPARAPVPAEAVSADEEPPQPRRLSPARLLVRMRQAVEPFVGPDMRQYRLGAEDVAAVPKEVAHLLIARQLAVAVGG